MRNIILSIYHRHAENIYFKKKIVEFRKSLPIKMPEKVYLYDTCEKKITGLFTVMGKVSIHSEAAINLQMWLSGAISYEEYREYWGLRKFHSWLAIDKAYRFDNPISLPSGIRAPQNFVYCGELHEECECGGTGFIGDNGPGITGNTEYCACDQCPAGEGK